MSHEICLEWLSILYVANKKGVNIYIIVTWIPKKSNERHCRRHPNPIIRRYIRFFCRVVCSLYEGRWCVGKIVSCYMIKRSHIRIKGTNYPIFLRKYTYKCVGVETKAKGNGWQIKNLHSWDARHQIFRLSQYRSVFLTMT